MLISNTPPERLTIHDCTINDSNITELKQTLNQADATEVCFQACHIAPKKIDLFTSILSQKNITAFSFNNCAVFPPGMKGIIDYIIANKSLCSLDLNYMRMGSENLSALLSGIKNQPLTALNLSGNMMGENEVLLLKEFLQNNTTLKELILFNMGLTDKGMESIASALQNHSSLTTLIVGENLLEIKSKDHPVVKLMDPNTTLTSLNLNRTTITQAGALELMKALKANNKISFFSLSPNKSWSKQIRQNVATIIEQTLGQRNPRTT